MGKVVGLHEASKEEIKEYLLESLDSGRDIIIFAVENDNNCSLRTNLTLPNDLIKMLGMMKQMDTILTVFQISNIDFRGFED